MGCLAVDGIMSRRKPTLFDLTGFGRPLVPYKNFIAVIYSNVDYLNNMLTEQKNFQAKSRVMCFFF